MVNKKTNIKVTGRTIAYIQDISKDGKIGKAKPVVLTAVVTGQPAPNAGKIKTTRKKRK